MKALLPLLLAQIALSVPEGAGPRIGESLAAHGSTLAVSCGCEKPGRESGGGRVFLFERREGAFECSAAFDPEYLGSNRPRPVALAIDGRTLAFGLTVDPVVHVSATCEMSPAKARNSVLIHGRVGETWAELERERETYPTSWFGAALDLDGDTLVVGAPSEEAPGTDWGAAYVFRKREGAWEREARLVPGRLDSRSYSPLGELGRAVAIHGDRIVAGAPGIPFTIGGGPAQIFERFEGEWRPSGMLEPRFDANDVSRPENQTRGLFFGASVDLADDQVVVGSPMTVGPRPSGEVWVFRRRAEGEDGWSVTQHLRPPAEFPTASRFGSRVLLREDLLFVAAAGGYGDSGRPSYAGSVFAYRRDGESWISAGAPLVGDPETQAEFAAAIAVAGDDLFIGAPGANEGQGAVFRYSIDERFPVRANLRDER